MVTKDLGAGEPCPQGDCPLCLSEGGSGGLQHHRSGAVYKGDCKLCPENEKGEATASYWGESGFSAYYRTLQHHSAIENRDEKNAFAKHLMIHHPEQEGSKDALKFSLQEVHNQPLPRQTSESCHINHNLVETPMNSKAEWHQPMVARVVITRELEELGGRRRAGGEAGEGAAREEAREGARGAAGAEEEAEPNLKICVFFISD